MSDVKAFTPAEAAKYARTHTGLEYMQEVLAGHLVAPFLRFLGFRFTEVAEGCVVGELEITEQFNNTMGGMHGAIYAALIDTVAGCAGHTLLEKDFLYTSTGLNVHFVRAAGPDTGVLTATGTVFHPGKRQPVGEASVQDSSGNLMAKGTVPMTVIPVSKP